MRSSTTIKSKSKEADIVKEKSNQNQSRGIDQMQVVSHGIKLIIINDIDNNFLPVLSTNFSNFKVTMDSNVKQFCFWTDLTTSVNFFNVNIGVWEPFIEQFTMNIMTSTEIENKK